MWIVHFKFSLLKISWCFICFKTNPDTECMVLFGLCKVRVCLWCDVLRVAAIAPCERSVACCTLKPPAQAMTISVAEDSSLNHTSLLKYFNLKRSLCNSSFFITLSLAHLNLLFSFSEGVLNKKIWFTVTGV